MGTVSKEEILATKNWGSEYPNYTAELEILDAMSEFAKQESIEFMNFMVNKEGCIPRKEDGIIYWYFFEGHTAYKADSNKMYELFQSSKQQ